MPANEDIWRSSKLMNTVFGVSALVMLIGTIWMFADDHRREWKDYQRQFRKIESWTTQARMAEERTAQHQTKEKELQAELAAAEQAVPDKALIEEFKTALTTQNEQADVSEIDAAYEALSAKPSSAARRKLVTTLTTAVLEAKRQENNLTRQMKFRRADLDVDKSAYDRGVGESQPPAVIAQLQAKVNATQDDVNRLALEVQDAKTHRLDLERIVARVTADETAIAKALTDLDADLGRLDESYEESRLSIFENLLTLPILDAFGRPLSPDQIWLPNLTLNNNFRDVARFDRCTTCHKGMDKTAPGSGVLPAYPHEEIVDVELATPDEDPRASAETEADASQVTQVSYRPQDSDEPPAAEVATSDGDADSDAAASEEASLPAAPKSPSEWIEEIYGLRLADKGIGPTDVTVAVVWPESAASRAELATGDVLLAIGDVALDGLDLTQNRAQLFRYLLDEVSWGEPVKLQVRRGLAHPFSSHPRLDLFVGPLSPHKLGDMGCTICHEGQGSATSFKWASHTPNTPKERERWATEHGWFNNHHWIFPMNPQRFLESSCLKCHHNVTELEPSKKFLDPPAPQLVRGFKLIQDYGCFGCHEINGYNGPDKRIGPDLRTEPPIYAAAEGLLADPGLTEQMRSLARQVVAHPEDDASRRLLAELVAEDAGRGRDYESDGEPVLSPASHKLGELVGADYEAPGTYRKVGPSLRHLAAKSDFNFVYNWIKEPKNFRPATKMPQFFGLWDHLTIDRPVDPETGEEGTGPTRGLQDAEKFEPIEIYATTHYLLQASQPFEYLAPPAGVTEAADVERGKKAFQIRGCLACHQHADFPEALATQGPDLSRLGSKLTTPEGKQWLYSWIKEPNRYHSRTVMPNLFLDPIPQADGKVTDPAADVTEYLVSSQGWTAPTVPEVDEACLDELALEHLSGSFTARQAREFLAQGIPEALAPELKGDERVLVGPMNMDKKLTYVGRRTISKLGCTGCHDIPGFEDAKPIGTALADWGRKDPSKLAFEQIARFIADSHAAHGGGGHGEADHGGGHAHGPEMLDLPPDEGYFMEALMGGQREGFLWQKLRSPRSYDYKKTENKTYNERLRMPKFPFTDSDIEAVMTFVLGLVSEPPKGQYIYQPKPRERALVEGRQTLDKYNCGGCHVLEMETWSFHYDPESDSLSEPPPIEDYAFTIPHFAPDVLEASDAVDKRGLGNAQVVGRAMVDQEGQVFETEDDDGNPALLFNLWESAAINGSPWLVGVTDLLLSQSQVEKTWPAVGGDLGRWLFPAVVADAIEANPTFNDRTKAQEVWGWLPPPLLNEGRKVQTDWLHAFLLDPYPIRPAAVLRMPKFNMSSEEAAQLVNYFAAVDGVEYPYEYDPRRAASHLAAEEAKHPNRMDDALKLVTNRNYCVQCHLVGDFVPEGAITAQAPQLGEVYKRLRPEFLRAWVANPKRLLPYTGMPVNFPVNKPAAPEIYNGTAQEQVEAVVDLLLHWDAFNKQQVSIKDKVPPPAPPADGQAPPAEGQAETGAGGR